MTSIIQHTAANSDAPSARDANVSQFARLIRWRDWVAAHLTTVSNALDALLARQAAWVCAIVGVLALQIALIAVHVPWLDELQALQIAVQSPHWSDLMVNLRYEGHPPLWYGILRGVAAEFMNPLTVLPVVAVAIAMPAQLVILLASPFSRAERVMISLSEFVLFEYLTITRSMSLGVAVMVLIALAWKRPRQPWLLIAILPLCDFLFGVISMLFVVLRWREGRISWPLVGLWLITGLFAMWSVRPMPDIVPAQLPMGLKRDIPLWFANIGTLGLPLQWNLYKPAWNYPSPPGLGGPAIMGFFAVAWIELRKRRDFVIAFGAFVFVLLIFSLTVYQMSVRHLSIIAMLLIVLVWRLADDGHARSIWWRAWLLVIAACGIVTAVVNLLEPFDTGPQAALVINRLGLQHKTWVAFPHNAGEGLAAINDMTFERLTQHCSEDFIRWNSPDEHAISGVRSLQSHLQDKVAADGKFYLMTRIRLRDNLPFVRRIATVAAGYDGQDYNIYVVGAGHADARPHGQACVGPHRSLETRN